MPSQLAERIAEQVSTAAGLYHRLVLVVGRPRTGKTVALNELAETRSWPIINVNRSICERLLALTIKQRALHVQKILGQIINEHDEKVQLLDNVEVLFSKELQQDPFRLLQWLSRSQTIVAAWAGEYDGHNLTYADSEHPEFRQYHKPDAVIVSTLDAQGESEQIGHKGHE